MTRFLLLCCAVSLGPARDHHIRNACGARFETCPAYDVRPWGPDARHDLHTKPIGAHLRVAQGPWPQGLQAPVAFVFGAARLGTHLRSHSYAISINHQRPKTLQPLTTINMGILP